MDAFILFVFGLLMGLAAGLIIASIIIVLLDGDNIL